MNTEYFFDSLSKRNWDENNVSDFLFALFKSSPDFHKTFINTIEKKYRHFDASGLTHKDILVISRESAYEEGRSDIQIIYKNNKEIVIENKLWDKNYHEDKYLNYFKNKHIVIFSIVKPILMEPDKFITLLWHELIDEMQQTKDPLILGVATICKELTKMETIKLVKLQNPLGLLYLNRMFKNSIKNCSLKGTTVQIFNKGKNFMEDSSGYYFEVSIGNYKIWAWYGLNYNEIHNDIIMIWIKKNWNNELFKKIFRILDKNKIVKDKKYNVIKSSEDIVYKMSQEQYSDFFTLEDKNEQQAIIDGFLNDFIICLKDINNV